MLLLSVETRKHKIKHYSVSTFLLYFLMQILITLSTVVLRKLLKNKQNFIHSIEKGERAEWRQENQDPGKAAGIFFYLLGSLSSVMKLTEM